MITPAIRTISRNTAYLMGAQAVTVASRLVWVVVAARILGPDLYALLAYSLTWQLAFLPLALFGVGPALSYLIGPDRNRIRDYAGHVLAIRLVTVVAAVIACVALSRVVTPDPRAPVLIAILSLALAARAFRSYTQTLFTAFEINQFTIRQAVLFSGLDLAVALLILLNDGSVIQLVAAKALVEWIQTASAMRIAHRFVVPISFSWQPSKWRPLMRLAVPALLGTLATDWCFNGSLVLFRNLTTDGILFGQYALAMQALTIASIPALALSRAAFPALRRAVARGDGKELLFASAIQRMAPIVGTAAGLIGLACGEPVFRWLLGEPFSTAGKLVGLTLWCLIPLTAITGYPETLIAHGRFRTYVALMLTSAMVMTLLTFYLAPVYGVQGAIFAAIAGFSVTPIGAFVVAWKWKSANPVTEVINPIVAALLAGIAFALLRPYSDWVALVSALLVLCIGTVVLRIAGPSQLRTIRESLSAPKE